jgi:hypothetical protein
MARSDVLVPHAPNARSDRDKLAAKAIRFMICPPKIGFANSGASRLRIARSLASSTPGHSLDFFAE